MRVIGTPGATSSELRRRRERRRHLIGIAGGLVALASLALGLPIVAGVLVVVTLLVRNHLRSRAYAARAGAAGEAEVAAQLRRLRPAVLLFDLTNGRGDIDAVVLGPMTATIEVKSGRGRVVAMDDGRVKVRGRWLPGTPLEQAYRQARVVRRAGGEDVVPVLCVVGMRGRPRYVAYRDAEILLTSARRIRTVLRRLPDSISNREARQIAHSLRSGNNPSTQARPSVH